MLEEKKPARFARVRLVLATIAAVGCMAFAVYQNIHSLRGGFSRLWSQSATQFDHRLHQSVVRDSDGGRRLLWASGPRDGETGEWFDITDSPLDPQGYQYGIGKDSIPAIDEPRFVSIEEHKTLREYGINDGTIVIGYVHNGEAKAYPISIMNRHELVNDVVGGKPVTVAW